MPEYNEAIAPASTTTTRIVVDSTKCVGHGLCESIAPGVFEVLDEGFVRIHQDKIQDIDRATVQDAVARCPSGALSVEL